MAKAKWHDIIAETEQRSAEATEAIQTENEALVRLMKLAVPDWKVWDDSIGAASRKNLIYRIENNDFIVLDLPEKDVGALKALGFKSAYSGANNIKISFSDPEKLEPFIQLLFKRAAEKYTDEVKEIAAKLRESKDAAEEACEGLSITAAYRRSGATMAKAIVRTLEGKGKTAER